VIRLSFFVWFFPVLVPQNQIAFFFNFGHLLHIIASQLTTMDAQSLCAPSDGASHRSVYVFFCKGRSVSSDRPNRKFLTFFLKKHPQIPESVFFSFNFALLFFFGSIRKQNFSLFRNVFFSFARLFTFFCSSRWNW